MIFDKIFPPAKIHMIGIGGISMSGLAEILKNKGYIVKGSDANNSNIVESYPGISLPLTDSFVNVAYTGVFKGLCTRVIRNKILLESLEDNFNNMVGSCNGRMYYKISNWYTLIKCMPFRKKMIKIWQK